MQKQKKVTLEYSRSKINSLDLVDRHSNWILPAPALILLVLLCIFPVAYTLYMSFHKWSGSRIVGPEFLWFKNYIDLFTTDERFWGALWRTVVYTFGCLVFQLSAGLGLAVLFNREFFGRGLMRTLYLMPFVATPAAIALVWMMMYNPAVGVFNFFLGKLALPGQDWAYSRSQVLFALVIVDTWEHVPLVMLICTAGLASLPSEIYESAEIDGASRFQQFIYLTLPLLRPTIAVAALFRTIDALKAFDIIFVMTQGGPGYASETLNIYSYFAAFQYLRFGYASSLLMVFFVIILGVCLVIIKLRREAEAANV